MPPYPPRRKLRITSNGHATNTMIGILDDDGEVIGMVDGVVKLDVKLDGDGPVKAYLEIQICTVNPQTQLRTEPQP